MTRRDALLLVPLSALGCHVHIGQQKAGQPDQPKQPEPQFTLDTGTLDVWGQKKVGPYQMAVSPNGKYLLAIAHAKTANVQVWDLESKKRLHAFDDENGTMNMPLAVSPDNRTAAYVGLRVSKGIAVIDMVEGKNLRVITDKKDRFTSYCKGLRFSPKGDLLIMAVGGAILTFDPKTGEPGREWADKSTVWAMSNFFDGGKKIASLNEAGVINIWDVATGKLLQTLDDGDPNKTYAVTFTEDGKTAISRGKKFKFWDVPNGKVRKEVDEMIGGHSHIAILPGERTAAWNKNFGFVLYDLATGEKKQEVKAGDKFVYALAVEPDGKLLLTGDDDGVIKGWALNADGAAE